ncbi:MAG: hypothetical protein GWN61_25015 [candidate division Zixibacteria bacterium]|nr:hypothetical protein [candidate division Zixibacteria bacterium]NIS49128.1 hypothetical protein [candidate division Zixibacteria bacterium]NIU17223.1 hypothetical protein [candidate division Zixibacteria bacterium]NIV09343.1 hypothetical protein [candidate division Zixibacteria bacterium]NIW50226.1 hypothetical protein [Gammaproteobacteria bacterium]
MRNKILVLVIVLVIALVAVIPAAAHSAPPCSDSGDPGNSDYAQHHIRFLANNGDLGKVDHDGDGIMHTPGVHQGFSFCNPSGN